MFINLPLTLDDNDPCVTAAKAAEKQAVASGRFWEALSSAAGANTVLD